MSGRFGAGKNQPGSFFRGQTRSGERGDRLTLSPERITRPAMRSECDRTRLIAELATLLRDCEVPDEARHAGLTLIGWLARRMPGEGPSIVGVEQASHQRGHSTLCAGANVAPTPGSNDIPRGGASESIPQGEPAPMVPLATSACCGSVVARVTASVIDMRKAR